VRGCEIEVCKNQNKHGCVRPTSWNFVSTKFSYPFALSVIFSFKNIHPSGNFKGKTFFKTIVLKRKLWCWCCYQSGQLSFLKNCRKNYFSGFLCSFYLASLAFGYLWNFSSTTYAANNNSKKENICGPIHVELRALLISGPPSCVCKKDTLMGKVAKDKRTNAW